MKCGFRRQKRGCGRLVQHRIVVRPQAELVEMVPASVRLRVSAGRARSPHRRRTHDTRIGAAAMSPMVCQPALSATRTRRALIDTRPALPASARRPGTPQSAARAWRTGRGARKPVVPSGKTSSGKHARRQVPRSGRPSRPCRPTFGNRPCTRLVTRSGRKREQSLRNKKERQAARPAHVPAPITMPASLVRKPWKSSGCAAMYAPTC